MATTESMFPDRSDFDYDYETLRTTGVILAVIMFVSGILIALSKKFTKCVKSSSNEWAVCILSRSHAACMARHEERRELLFERDKRLHFGLKTFPAPLVPKFQRQRCLLKLYRKQQVYWKKRRSSQEPSQRKNTMAIPLMADVPLPAG
ncbi:uncharacterized protein AB9X84_023295 [Acanthopagrus schlegelii]